MTVCTNQQNQEDKQLKECEEWVRLFLKDFGPDDIFFDAEFEYSDGSLKWDEHGTILHFDFIKKNSLFPINLLIDLGWYKNGTLNYQKIKNETLAPLTLYKDTWPFHAHQGNIGDCWLIAPLMTIARRQKLLEWIIPPNEYCLKHGIFLVRLFFNGEWQIVVVDGHLACNEQGSPEFASTYYKRLWPCLIEKAVAKMLGGYHKLDGANLTSAFKYLTGSKCLEITLNKDTDLGMLWAKLKAYQSNGFLMALSSHKEQKDISKKGLSNNHAYSLLDVCIHNGHRLVLVGAPNATKWNGKWFDLPAYSEEVSSNWNKLDMYAVEKRFSWMEIDDLCKQFEVLVVCRYHEDWFELRTGRVQFNASSPEKILRINLNKRCKLVVRIVPEYKRWRDFTEPLIGLINVHHATKDNQIGNLIFSSVIISHSVDSHPENNIAETDEFEMNSGSVFIIFSFLSQRNIYQHEFVIRSPSPVDHISYDFVSFEYNLASHKSLLNMIESVKPAIQIRQGLFIREYSEECFLILMVENRTDKQINISVIAKSENDEEIPDGLPTEGEWNLFKHHFGGSNPPAPYIEIPAKSKCVIGSLWTLSKLIKFERQPTKRVISCTYWIRIREEEIKKQGEYNKRRIREKKKIEPLYFIMEKGKFKPVSIK
ncbi:hypothetical protein CRE_16056 [Caenorhabditis remanei]|uniref:Calpain catalytic domain-containing protein n=1 Tax=Caenorhabditis remanei TaxID=31234 RepID=E3MBK9_CAERE|nr:hypothetical protein CRE_16056 [Caenorhabditis remanei]